MKLNNTNQKYFQYTEDTKNGKFSQGFIMFEKQNKSKRHLISRGFLSVIKFKFINFKVKLKRFFNKINIFQG